MTQLSTMTKTKTFDFIINREGGGAIKAGVDNISRNLNDVFGTEVGNVHMVRGAELTETINRWMADHKGDDHTLMIGGGDGTILTAATETMKQDVVFGIVPLGTQGFVKKLLGLPPDYVQAMRAYKEKPLSVQALDVGHVNGKPFLYGLMLDPGSVYIFEAREHHRHNETVHVIRSALASAYNLVAGHRLRLNLEDGTQIRARMASITVNAMTPRGNSLKDFHEGGLKQVFGNSFARNEICDGQMVLYTHSGRIDKLLTLGKKLWDGTWDKAMDQRKGAGFYLESNKTSEISIILDGEIVKASFPMKIDLMPNALKLYRPA